MAYVSIVLTVSCYFISQDNTYYIIGLNFDQSGAYEWEDGSPLTYTNFVDGKYRDLGIYGLFQ